VITGKLITNTTSVQLHPNLARGTASCCLVDRNSKQRDRNYRHQSERPDSGRQPLKSDTGSNQGVLIFTDGLNYFTQRALESAAA